MEYTAIIPARGGSKGIPGKNIKEINGKPLISWSIQQALSCKKIKDVYVSTDALDIQNIALKYGAKSPFLRPKELSDDKSSTESAILHFIDWCEKENIKLENIILIQATSPFRYPSSLLTAIQLFESNNADSLVTVTKTHKFIWKNPSNPCASYDLYQRPRRQDIRPEDAIYFENGSFYITKLDVYKNYKNRLGGKIVMHEMSHEESFEIDDLVDFQVTELMMNEYGMSNDS
ncbi:MAG: acylneuraminate cytidylyltransferase family protein [Methylomarinum sp.]|nr:acylneuraminate cytidylyltransferase family protein [Methylomarinum sp.]